MPLLRLTNNYVPYAEWEMQVAIEKWLLEYQFSNLNLDPQPKVYREIHIPEIGRRSDLIVFFSKRKIFNIECKLFNADEVMRQATDHLQWADYSYVCFPHNAYVPNLYRSLMMKKGIGLLQYIPDFGLIESVIGMHNSKKNKQIRENVLKTLKRVDRKNSQQHIIFNT